MLKSQTQIAGAIEMPIDECVCNKYVKLVDFVYMQASFSCCQPVKHFQI